MLRRLSSLKKKNDITPFQLYFYDAPYVWISKHFMQENQQDYQNFTVSPKDRKRLTDLHKFTQRVSACFWPLALPLWITQKGSSDIFFRNVHCESSWSTRRGCPKRLWESHPWRFSELDKALSNLTNCKMSPALRRRQTMAPRGPFQPTLYLRLTQLSVLWDTDFVSSEDLHLAYFLHLKYI